MSYEEYLTSLRLLKDIFGNRFFTKREIQYAINFLKDMDNPNYEENI